MIRVISSEAAAEILTRRPTRLGDAEAIVRPIIDDVRAHGDEAVLRYARKFDHYARTSPVVPSAELDQAKRELSPALRIAILTAAANVRTVAERQMPQPWSAETPRIEGRTDR